ncbi:MAG TPA: type II toxin-antitoxin system VapC family toxin [Methylomirabilota bacterium]|nr:type II toxin-antitoxin system VapC family toxin [Methylomirabilota bacterium]
MTLLDTHTLLWLCLEPKRLSATATTAIKKSIESGGLAIASITLWEIAMMIALGRLTPRGTPEAWLTQMVERSGLSVKEITPAVATLATNFPDDFPADPADRLIAATARAEGIPLVTRDAKLRASAVVRTVW